jgi:hypothetical protein
MVAQAKASTPGRRRSTRGRTRPGQTPAMPPPLCSVAFCPICTAVTAIGQARPDVMEHVLVAGREMLVALRALIDARLEGAGDAPTRLERLTIE